jgi:hypothetical protein
VLVCRRLHKTTVFMAKDLGSSPSTLAASQHLPDSALIDASLLAELTNDLGIIDLVQGDGPEHTGRLEIALGTLQRRFDVQTAIDRWRSYATDPDIFQAISTLVNDRLPNAQHDHPLAVPDLHVVAGRLAAPSTPLRFVVIPPVRPARRSDWGNTPACGLQPGTIMESVPELFARGPEPQTRYVSPA